MIKRSEQEQNEEEMEEEDVDETLNDRIEEARAVLERLNEIRHESKDGRKSFDEQTDRKCSRFSTA